MNFFKLLLFCLFFTYSYASSILIDDSKKTIDVLSKSQIYIDHTRKLSIDEISSGDIKFEKNDRSLLGFGYSPNFDVWVRFTLKNTTDKKIEKILEYDNCMTTDIRFFEDNRLKKIDGLLNINKKRKSLTPIFKISFEPKEEKVFFIKTSSYITTLIVKLNLWEIDGFYKKEIKHQVILALFFGAMCVLALYNLFIFFFIREVSYLFYVLYIFGIICHHLMYVGFGSLYYKDVEIIEVIVKYASLLVVFPAISLAFFTKTYLNTIQYKKINLILNLLIVIVFLSSTLFLISDQFNHYRNLFPFLLLIYLMIVTIYATLKRNRQAYFILFGWVIFLSSGAFMYLSSVGVLNIYNDFPYYVEVSLVLEAIIFSVALAYKIKQLQKEKNEMNKKLIIQEKEEGNRLKIQVEKRTKDLREALDEKTLLLQELSHRVKNNLQTIISLVRLQADDIDDERVEDIFNTVQNRISAMSRLHELLYQQDSISHINTFDYFDLLVDDLKQSYNSKNIEIELDINADLLIDQAMYCGLILNELITNSVKYAFEDKNGTIIVSLQKVDNEYRFNIKDNGVGFKDTGPKESLGLLLVETLSKKQLKGDINIDATDGVNVDIWWSK